MMARPPMTLLTMPARLEAAKVAIGEGPLVKIKAVEKISSWQKQQWHTND